MNCLRCSTPMDYKKGILGFNRPSYHQCPQCEGIWCDKDSFESLVNREDIHERPDSEFKPTEPSLNCPNCPNCKEPLTERHLSDENGTVVLDYCTKCSGAWFDATEGENIGSLKRNNWIFLLLGILLLFAIEYLASQIFNWNN